MGIRAAKRRLDNQTPATAVVPRWHSWQSDNDNGKYQNGEITLSRMNFSGYVGHVTSLHLARMITIASCSVAGL